MTERYYRVAERDIKERIRWCRETFGPRGSGWDFSGGYKSCDIAIWDNEYQVTYILRWA